MIDAGGYGPRYLPSKHRYRVDVTSDNVPLSTIRFAVVALIPTAVAQSIGPLRAVVPRFEDYRVMEELKRPPIDPILTSQEERRYRKVIRQGVKGYGVEGSDGKTRPGPNFAGHYTIVTWGCGSPCLMAAIVDTETGRVEPPPFHHGPGHSYFQVPWAFPSTPPLDYRLDSRLLITNVCEADKVVHVGNRVSYEPQRCGLHYFIMNEDGLKLVYRVLE